MSSNRPITVPTLWAENGQILPPSSGKKEAGWTDEERPPAEFMNYLQNIFAGWTNYLQDVHKFLLNFDAAITSPGGANPVGGFATDNTGFHMAVNGVSAPFVTQGNERLWVVLATGPTGASLDVAWCETPQKFVLAHQAVNGISHVPGSFFVFPEVYTLAIYVGAAPGTPMRGVTWEESAAAGGIGIAVGGSAGTEEIYTSPDAINWTKRAAPANPGQLNAVAFGNGVWIAVGVDIAGPAERIIRSADNGATWADVTPGGVINDQLENVAYDPVQDLWMTIGHAAGPGQRVWTSIDAGLTWVNRTATAPDTVQIESLPTGLAAPVWGDIKYDAAFGGFLIADARGLLFTTDATSFNRLVRYAGGATPGIPTRLARLEDPTTGLAEYVVGDTLGIIFHGKVFPLNL